MLIHVMNDGTVRKSVVGVTIKSKEFYQLFFELQKKYNKKKGA